MDYRSILRRAWQITWRYKALWLFGFLFALFSGGGGGDGGRGMQYRFASGDWPPDGRWIGVMIAVGVLALMLGIVGIVLRYVSRGAMVEMVKDVEEKEAMSAQDGFRIGLRHFWRLLGIDLLIGIPVFFAVMVLLAIAASPLLLLLAESEGLTVLAVVMTVGLMLLAIPLIILIGLAVSVWVELAVRECMLQGKGVVESMRNAYRLGRANLGKVAGMWLRLVGIGLLFGLGMLAASAIVFGIAAAPAAAVYAATGEALPTTAIAFLFAAPGMLLLALVRGVYEVFQSAVWTLFYREM